MTKRSKSTSRVPAAPGVSGVSVPMTPKEASIRQGLGTALQKLKSGDLATAESYYKEILRLDPRRAEAVQFLGVIALRRGRLEEAAGMLSQATVLNADYAAAHINLGLALHMAGNYRKAAASYRRALGLEPESVQALSNLGNTLAELGDMQGAAEHYRKAIALQPRFPEALSNLGHVNLALGNVSAAEINCTEAIKLRPGMAEAHTNLGNVHTVLENWDKAIAAHRKALGLDPKLVKAMMGLALTYRAMGRESDAKEWLREILEIEPGNGEAHRGLALVSRHAIEEGDRQAMLAAYDNPDIKPADRMHLGFGLGEAFEEKGEYDAAFAYFGEGNRLKRRTFVYDKQQALKTFDDIKSVFTTSFFAERGQAGYDDDTPIFVVGMPRSGTTLAEQVLGSHPEVFGAGEPDFLQRAVLELFDGPGAFRFAAIADRLDDEALAKIGRTYVEQLRKRAPEARHIVDKMPGNFLLTGLIKLALPKARIVHLSRDPADTCLSIFKNYFASAKLGYAYDQNEVGHYYGLYADLMAHWHTVVPGFITDLSYEALVTDQEKQTRRLLAGLGLEWAEKCLRFFESGQAVRTASAEQVRRPIFESSVGLAKKYGGHLEPLRTALAARPGRIKLNGSRQP